MQIQAQLVNQRPSLAKRKKARLEPMNMPGISAQGLTPSGKMNKAKAPTSLLQQNESMPNL